jgi:DNA-binding LytR/AlgR family response regulator
MKIINCIIVDDEPTAREILQIHINKLEGINIIALCKNATTALAILNEKEVDLIFLDINMPDISGISLAKLIPKKTKIIFTTAYREYAIDGFDLQAVDYLLKPIALDRLLQAVQKYRMENERQPRVNKAVKEYILVRSERKMIKIDWKQIKYVESLGDYLKIHTPSKVIITRETITNVEAKLPAELFIRIHRSFIIAMTFVDAFTAEYVEIGERMLPVSRSYRGDFLERMEEGN